jgi:1-acyl-sn-glycerol-3-phosphate acyltransferase
MARKNIYDKDLFYSFLKRFWVDNTIKCSYRKTEVHGLENIPEDGAIIFSPNHCNTLMDALAVLRSYKGLATFGARADMFRRPLFAKAMYFFRILPMVRQRDGLRNVLQNNQTQEIIVDVLDHNVGFCIFPEGKHRTKHSLQQFGKGVSRIALAANEKFGTEKPVYIIPTGIEYGDYFRYRSTSLVNYGKAVNATEFFKNGNFENEAQAIDGLRKELAAKVAELITFIPDDENYEAKWSLLKMLAIYGKKKGYGDYGTNLYDSMLKNREIAAEIEKLVAEKPEKAEKILERAAEFDKKRRKAGISIYSFRKMSPKWNAFGKGVSALLGLPYFIFCAIAALPMWAVSFKIRKGTKDAAFGNTVSFGVRLAMKWLIFAIYAALAFCLAPWWLAAALLILSMPSYYYFHDYIEGCRRWISDIRLLKNKKLYKEFKSIVKDFR